MRILLDTNIILDYVLEREPFIEEANILFNAIQNREVIAYATATTITDIFYLVRRETKSLDKARRAIALILQLMEIASVSRDVIESAFHSNVQDFEDAVQIACAMMYGLEGIVIRNATDFVGGEAPILSVRDCL